MVFLRVASQLLFLFTIILSIPLAFDVGGRACGLAFSLSLAVFYFFYSLLRLVTPDESRFRNALVTLVGAAQWFVIPALLIWSLNKFSIDSDQSSGWVERTFGGKRADFKDGWDWIFGRFGLLESLAVRGWDTTLRWSTPVFQLSEGFCSLLVIQAAGQITKWLVNGDGGDSWMIGLLIMSASIISSATYFLYRITTFPEIGNVDAILIGAAITCAIFLCVWGIVSGRGNPVESSLLFAYITLTTYQIFTDYQPTNPQTASAVPAQPAFPPLPPIIMASYTTLIHALSTLPSTILSTYYFLAAALMTITPSVLISLAYRVIVLYFGARIIPYVRENSADALSEDPTLDDSNEAAQFIALLRTFSPSILIAVYTSLLMQHFAVASTDMAGEVDPWVGSGAGPVGGNIWRWLNLAGTMALYALELHLGQEDGGSGLKSHWKLD